MRNGSVGAKNKVALETTWASERMMGTSFPSLCSRRPSYREPVMLSWIQVSPMASLPLWWSAAILALVPVPHGARS